MPVDSAVVIRDLASLDRWRRQLRSTLRSRDLPIVQFQMRQVSPEQNQSFSALAGGSPASVRLWKTAVSS